MGQTLRAQWSEDGDAGWFFDFLRADLATLTPGQQLGMCADAAAFAVPVHTLAEDTSGMLDENGRPTIASLEALQRNARAGIQRIREGDWFEIEPGMSWGFRRDGSQIVRMYRGGDFQVRFLAAVGDVVQRCWPRLRECLQ